MHAMLKLIARAAAIASHAGKGALINPQAAQANGLQRLAFCFSGILARLMQETDRSVS
ncbi:MAG: hypothetical protein KIT82_13210 [Bradyrhizobium sp.]|nr:hypothetical protein [Bradyrhizobium sp.]